MRTDRKDRFKERFQKHYSRLCHIAYGYVANRDDSEDIVQELFINVWNKGKDELPENEFVPYMNMAVRNSCISFLRGKQDGTLSIDEHMNETSLVASEEHDENRPHPEEVLEDALSSLPPKCKEIFMMAKLRNMKYREIAHELNLSEKTIENQMTKAIRLLREYVSQKGVLLISVIFIVVSVLLNL